MLSNLALLPVTYWLFVLTVLFATVKSAEQVRHGTGLPLLAVVFTVSVWYGLDVIYNDYANDHQIKFDYWTLSIGWVQVSVFLLATLFFVSKLNRGYRRKKSQAYYLYQHGVKISGFQNTLNNFYRVCFYIWCFLVVLACVTIGLQVIYFIFPFLGTKVQPFLRPRIGGGFSAVFALAQNLYILVGCGFGLVAALSTNKRIRRYAIILCCLTWPFFIVDRTRNAMLAVMLPSIIAYVFIRLRVSNIYRIVVLVGFFITLNLWLLFVMDARNSGVSVTNSFSNASGTTVRVAKRHEGLNMYEELSWLNSMIADNSFGPNWGYRYFAEIANPIPRVLWRNKPTIGLDYAVARGQSFTIGGGAVTATISTGMIGQGVNNFGRFIGPLASALLISIWVTALARLDTNANSFLRLPLVLFGLVLTFNMGRDITLLVVYPLVFGWMLIRYSESRDKRRRERNTIKLQYSKLSTSHAVLQPGFQPHNKPRDRGHAVNAKNNSADSDWTIRSTDCEIDVGQLETGFSDGSAINKWQYPRPSKSDAVLQPEFKTAAKPLDPSRDINPKNSGAVSDWEIISLDCEIDLGQLEVGVATNSTTQNNDVPNSGSMMVFQWWSNVRSIPDSNGDILTVLAAGEAVTQIGKNSHWIEIRVDKRPSISGYMHSSTLAPR